MADFIRVDSDSDENIFDLIGKMPEKALLMLRETIDDIADEIERDANEGIPEDTGHLRSVGITRKDNKRRVRGPGGLVVKTELSVPTEPEYAKWVHDGTGIYGPRGMPIIPRTAKFMVFQIDGKWFHKHEVYGQKPQPFLRDAVEHAQRATIPVELAELRAKIETLL
jgi:hypothetical protein